VRPLPHDHFEIVLARGAEQINPAFLHMLDQPLPTLDAPNDRLQPALPLHQGEQPEIISVERERAVSAQSRRAENVLVIDRGYAS
jgi:hypothetical protein